MIVTIIEITIWLIHNLGNTNQRYDTTSLLRVSTLVLICEMTPTFLLFF